MSINTPINTQALSVFTLRSDISKALKAICGKSSDLETWFARAFAPYSFDPVERTIDICRFNDMRADLQTTIASVCTLLTNCSEQQEFEWWYDNTQRFAKVLKLAAYLEGKNAVDVLGFEPASSDVPYWLLKADKLLEEAPTRDPEYMDARFEAFKAGVMAYVDSHSDSDVVQKYFAASKAKRARTAAEKAVAEAEAPPPPPPARLPSTAV